VLIEASWLLNNRMGATAHASFLHDISTDLASEKMKLAELLPVDVVRMAELVHTYRDARLDSTDASVIALAERHRITQVATLDRRDFTIVRPRHCAALTLFP
jgi:predicted nucleic acid-binding protein